MNDHNIAPLYSLVDDARAVLDRYEVPYNGMIVVDDMLPARPEGDGRQQLVIVFTQRDCLDRIAAGEHKEISSYAHRGFKPLGFGTREFGWTISLDQRMVIIGR